MSCDNIPTARNRRLYYFREIRLSRVQVSLRIILSGICVYLKLLLYFLKFIRSFSHSNFYFFSKIFTFIIRLNNESYNVIQRTKLAVQR